MRSRDKDSRKGVPPANSIIEDPWFLDQARDVILKSLTEIFSKLNPDATLLKFERALKGHESSGSGPNLKSVIALFGSLENAFIQTKAAAESNLSEGCLNFGSDAARGGRTVYRFFEPADRFIGIRVLGSGSIDTAMGGGKNISRAQYRREVVRAATDAFTDLAMHPEKLMPDDPILAEDLLYQLVIEVNPSLDIHVVRLRAEDSRSRSAGEANEPRAELPSSKATISSQRVLTLEEGLSSHIFGQSEPIRRVSQCIATNMVDREGGKPLASFLLRGPTGVGKTELARGIARHLFGDDKTHLLRIDCGEFQLSHETAKLIGSPPGYVGHEDGGKFEERAKRSKGRMVVLFDEIEKANKSIYNLCLGILDDGRVTTGKNHEISFENSIVIMTSNIGSREVNELSEDRVGFKSGRPAGSISVDVASEAIERACREHFPAEFLGRFDDIIDLAPLSKTEIEGIAAIELRKLQDRQKRAGYIVHFDESVAPWIGKMAYDPRYNAREIKRTIHREIRQPYSSLILESELEPHSGRRIVVSEVNGALSFKIEKGGSRRRTGPDLSSAGWET